MKGNDMSNSKRCVYVLRSEYKGDGQENIGVYESPEALVEGLATVVAANHQGEKAMDVARAVGLAVYDFLALPGNFPPSEADECVDGDTRYGWDREEVLSSSRGKGGAK